MRNTYITRIFIVLTFVLLFSTITPRMSHAESDPLQTFRFNLYLEPVTLDPALSSDGTTSTII